MTRHGKPRAAEHAEIPGLGDHVFLRFRGSALWLSAQIAAAGAGSRDRSRRSRAGTAQCDHGRRRRARRPHDDDRRRPRADRRHGDPAARAATSSRTRSPAPSSSATRSASSTGSTQVDELGTIETPIVLTNTLSVGVAMDAVVRYTLGQPGNEQVRSVNAVVGETNDGGLNDIRGLHVTTRARARRDSERGDRAGRRGQRRRGHGHDLLRMERRHRHLVAARRAPTIGGYTVGVLAQTNFGGRLTIAGVPVWRNLQPPRAAALAAPPSSARRVQTETGPACSSSPPTRRSTRAISIASPRAPSSASRAPARRTATAAAISRSPSRRRREMRSRFGETAPRAHVDAADRRHVAALRGGARGDGGSRLQFAAPGDDGALGDRLGRSDSRSIALRELLKK